MTPEKITLLLTALAALVVVLTRIRLRSDRAAGRLSVSSTVTNVHTVCGVIAVALWITMFLADDRLYGWLALPFWWGTVVAGLLVLVRWLPPRGRHSSGPVTDSWGEGPGLSILAHVGMAVGVTLFTVYLALGQLPS